VLATTEDLLQVCDAYFGLGGDSGEGGGNEGDGGEGREGGEREKGENSVMILHAVVRPPLVPMRRKGNRKDGEGGRGGGASVGEGGDDALCGCCTVQ